MANGIQIGDSDRVTAWLPCLTALLLMLAASGCRNNGDGNAPAPPARKEVVVYAALDREFSEPILQDFEKETGIVVLDKYDIESTKTLGLVEAIIAEQNRPRCDLFWNNEILHSLRLKKLGLLDVYTSPRADVFPASYHDSEGQWHGFAARARILIVNTELLPRDEWPDSIEDLVDPRWRGKVGIAKPRYGTTGSHAGVLFATWGDERATEFFGGIKENCQVMSGNKQVALAVASGQLAWGITDTDDAIVERDKGMSVEIIFPDQGDDQMGALLIPNTLCLVKGAANGENARQLVDHLLTADVEARLATGRSAQFPVARDVETKSRAFPEHPLKWMDVDFQAAADKWESAQLTLRDLFLTGE